jgi:phage shock protein PspC (stress-responsive transcriptional regulator)
MYCTRCGVQVDDAARFCSGCGNATPTGAAQSNNFSDPRNNGGYRPLVRIRNGSWIGGVCTGLARYWGLDPALVRILFIALALCPVLPAIIPYIVCWIVMPWEPESQSAGFRQPMPVNQ